MKLRNYSLTESSFPEALHPPSQCFIFVLEDMLNPEGIYIFSDTSKKNILMQEKNQRWTTSSVNLI